MTACVGLFAWFLAFVVFLNLHAASQIFLAPLSLGGHRSGAVAASGLELLTCIGGRLVGSRFAKKMVGFSMGLRRRSTEARRERIVLWRRRGPGKSERDVRDSREKGKRGLRRSAARGGGLEEKKFCFFPNLYKRTMGVVVSVLFSILVQTIQGGVWGFTSYPSPPPRQDRTGASRARPKQNRNTQSKQPPSIMSPMTIPPRSPIAKPSPPYPYPPP